MERPIAGWFHVPGRFISVRDGVLSMPFSEPLDTEDCPFHKVHTRYRLRRAGPREKIILSVNSICNKAI